MHVKWALWIIIMSICQLMMAQKVMWDGNSDGDGDNVSWHDPLNWDVDQVPTFGDSAIIEMANANTAVIDGFIAEASFLQVDNGAMLHLQDNALFFVDGEMMGISNAIVTIGAGSTLTNDGFLYVENAKLNAVYLYGTLENYGTLNISNTVQQAVLSTGSMYDYGIITIDSSGNGYLNSDDALLLVHDTAELVIKKVDESPALFNSGEIRNAGQILIDSCEMGFTNYDSFTNNGLVSVSNDQDTSSSSGMLHGHGTFQLLDFINDGVITPGIVIDTMHIAGNLYMEDGSRYQVELSGTAGAGNNDGHDLLVVSDVHLNGVLEVQLNPAFSPDSSDHFEVLSYYGTLSGTFDQLILPSPEMDGWVVDYGVISVGRVILRYGGCIRSIEKDCMPDRCIVRSGLYQVQDSIQYTGDLLIPANEDVIFDAGLGVDVMSTLEVVLGASFEIETDGCGP
ncbi:MAG: hypothetical protein HKN87_06190 [Saprospiraceae bacterium]|nr:hypothetical protein [Saprospiraceae bacterium]